MLCEMQFPGQPALLGKEQSQKSSMAVSGDQCDTATKNYRSMGRREGGKERERENM